MHVIAYTLQNKAMVL